MTASKSSHFPKGRKFPQALVATGLAAVLVGCGGGGSDDVTMTGPTPAQQVQTAIRTINNAANKAAAQAAYDSATGPNSNLSDQQKQDLMRALDAKKAGIDMATIRTALNNAQGKVDAITDNSSDQDVMDAKDYLKAFRDAIDDATDLTSDQKDPYNTTYGLLSGNLTRAEDSRNQAIAHRNNQRRLDNNKLSDAWADAITKYKPPAAASAAGSLKGLNSGTPVQAKVDKPTSTTGVTSIMVRDSNGLALTATSGNIPTHPTRDFTWTKASRFEHEPNPRTTHKGQFFTNLGPAVRQSTRTAYDQYFDLTGNAQPLDNIATSTADTTGVLEFSTTAISNSNPLTNLLFTGPVLPNAPSTGQTFRDVVINNGSNVDGTFVGVPGNFECGGSGNCSIRRDQSGVITFVGGDLTFTPRIPSDQTISNIAVRFETILPDNDYLLFGYWATSVVGRNGVETHSIETYSEAIGYGNLPNSNDTSALRGSATYDGNAAGIYVLKTGTPNTSSYVVSNGEFLADVELKAQFGNNDGSVADAHQYLVSGTIDGFESTTMPNHDLSNWSLALTADIGSGRSATTGVLTPSNFNVVGGEIGSGQKTTNAFSGTWTGTFAGSYNDHSTDPVAAADNRPEAIVGQFVADSVNGHVAGAFGAELVEETIEVK
ncbi:MAG: hypothetical protein F4157_01740 [Synechococcus sp. SB0675_bin_6]|nr:hypothetical protein [Synechococcus sp. SB0675_bin_6]